MLFLGLCFHSSYSSSPGMGGINLLFTTYNVIIINLKYYSFSVKFFSLYLLYDFYLMRFLAFYLAFCAHKGSTL